MTAPPAQQWTVGQLRAELVGIPDDARVAVDISMDEACKIRRRVPLIGAGYGPGIDPSDPIFSGQDFPLAAELGPVGPDEAAAENDAQ